MQSTVSTQLIQEMNRWQPKEASLGQVGESVWTVGRGRGQAFSRLKEKAKVSYDRRKQLAKLRVKPSLSDSCIGMYPLELSVSGVRWTWVSPDGRLTGPTMEESQ